jgi:hypothetical protein
MLLNFVLGFKKKKKKILDGWRDRDKTEYPPPP